MKKGVTVTLFPTAEPAGPPRRHEKRDCHSFYAGLIGGVA